MGNQALREFDINIVNLENRIYSYEYELTRAFFEAHPDSLIEDGKGKAYLELDKSETMLQLKFTIDLWTELTCDVSLEKFDYHIESSDRLIIKFGQEDIELSEDVLVIAQGTQAINVASIIHEFVILQIPMKKIHPDLRDKDRPDLIYTSKVEEENKNEVDPRWAALEKLKKQK